jgi:hypothetical protein
MIQRGESLATWQLASPPQGLAEGASLPARRIQPHRLAYLGYQGPVSDGRGEVIKIDGGECQVIAITEDMIELDFRGGLLRGRLALRRIGVTEAAEWELSRLSAS